MSDCSVQLEASSELDVPPRSWAAVCAAANSMVQFLFPHGVVALRIVNETGMRQLNQAYRANNTVTDVLSFPVPRHSLHNHRGDIALCWPVVERQALANGNAVKDEAVALVAHGLLHLAGFDHDTAAADQQMQQLTVKLCLEAGIEVSRFGH